MAPLLQIKDLQISFKNEDGFSVAVSNCSFNIALGKITALIGESGSGKSATALSLMQLLPTGTKVSGNLVFSDDKNRSLNLATISKENIRKLRGNKIAMIFQEPMTSLNPVHTCGAQVMESLKLHKNLSTAEAKKEVIELFKQVELPSPEQMLKRYPHQISGGQKQRVMIAMAMSCKPALLIADEPTTALDVRVQKKILQLLKKLQQENGMGILLITHDLSLVADVADEVVIMYKGTPVESGETLKVLSNPQHIYTKALLACKPTPDKKGKKLQVVADFLENDSEINNVPSNSITLKPGEKILDVQELKVYFPSKKNVFGKVLEYTKAVDDVSFSVFKNETVGLVGESGCGKTTLGRAILNLIKPLSGNIIFKGKNISAIMVDEMRIIRKELQIVFQDPYGSLNPRLMIGDAISEPMKEHYPSRRKNERVERTVQLLEEVNLPADILNRYPHQFSGGQRQRICIARALSLDPDFLIFDESVSALDVSVQAQVLNLINELKAKRMFTSIFISHDLNVINYISDRVMVMFNGKIIEADTAENVFNNPKQEYTKQLLASVPGYKI